MIGEVLHPDFVIRDPNSEEVQARGAQAMKGKIEHFRSAFPDLTYTVEDRVAEADTVVSRYTVRGTHRGEDPTEQGPELLVSGPSPCPNSPRCVKTEISELRTSAIFRSSVSSPTWTGGRVLQRRTPHPPRRAIPLRRDHPAGKERGPDERSKD